MEKYINFPLSRNGNLYNIIHHSRFFKILIKFLWMQKCIRIVLEISNEFSSDVIETAKILSALNITAVKLHSLYISKNTLLCERYEKNR